MQSYLSGQDLTIAVPLTRGGEPFVPDAGELAWSLRGHDGVELNTGAVTGVVDTTAFITILATHNGISQLSEKRTLVVTGLVDGQSFQILAPYRLTDFLNHAVTGADVRTFIGLDEGELPDAEIDLSQAYLDIVGTVGLQTLQEALAGDEAAESSANRAILAKAVIALVPSLAVRISKAQSDGTSKVERFDIDIADIERRARELLAGSIVGVTSTETADRTLLVFTTRTDPLTGA